MNLQMDFAGKKLVRESFAANEEVKRVKSIRNEASKRGNRNLQAIGFELRVCKWKRACPYI